MAEKRYFRTPVDDPKTTITPSGEEIENIWEMKLDEKGNEEFYIAGKTNVWEKIQAHLEETKIENILARCIDTGDYSTLEKAQGFYADVTEMPKNIFEANRMVEEARNIFDNLPLETRKAYEFNFNKFLEDYGSENWLKNMNIKENSKNEPTEEVKEKSENE